MATTRRPNSGPSNKKNRYTDLLTDVLPPNVGRSGVGTSDRETPLRTTVLPADLIDFDNEKLKVGWRKIIDSQRKGVETDVLKISPPRAKLDPIAKTALEDLRVKLVHKSPIDGSAEAAPPQDLEKYVRGFITRRGIASEVKKVTDRLNARRITDGRRWVLATTYEFILAKLFQDRGDELEEFIKDDLGVAEKILLELDSKGGPLDGFVNLIVNSVMKRNRINPSNTLREIVSQQVRAAI